MNNYEFYLSDVSFINGEETAQINNTESVFGALPGSQIFINGESIPETLISVDNANRTILIARPWQHENLTTSIKISPVASASAMESSLSAINNLSQLTSNLLSEIKNPNVIVSKGVYREANQYEPGNVFVYAGIWYLVTQPFTSTSFIQDNNGDNFRIYPANKPSTFYTSDFGALDGADNTIPIQDAIDAAPSGSIIIDNVTHSVLSDKLTVTSKTLRLKINSVLQTAASNIVNFDGGIDFILPITAIDRENRVITVNVSELAVGDVIKIISDDRLEGTRPAENGTSSRQGQFATVREIDVAAGTFRTQERIRFDYVTNARLVKLSGHSLNIEIEHAAYSPAVSGHHSAVLCYNAVHPQFAITFGQLPFIGINLFGAYCAWIRRVFFQFNPINIPTKGHGISDFSCYGTRVDGLKSCSVRHSFTTNQTPIVPNSDEIWFYGPSYGGFVKGAQGDGVHSTFIDTHHGCEDFVFVGCNYVGQSASINVRGRRITWIGAQIDHARAGLLIFSEWDVDVADYSEDVVFLNPIMRNLVGSPIRVQRTRAVKIINPIIKSSIDVSEPYKIAQIEKSDVVIDSGDFECVGNNEANQSLFLLLNGSSLRLKNHCDVNIVSAHSGSAPRIVGSGSDTEQSFIADNLTIKSAADIPLLVASNGAITENVEAPPLYVRANLRYEGVTEFRATNSLSILRSDSAIDVDGPDLTRGSKESTVTYADGDFLLDKLYIGTRNYFLTINANSDITLGGISEVAQDGSELIVRNGSANIVTIPEGLGANGVTVEHVSSKDNVLKLPRQCTIYRYTKRLKTWFEIDSTAPAPAVVRNTYNTLTENEILAVNSEHMRIVIRCNPSSGNTTLGGFTKGLIDGQTLTIHNIHSTNTITVPALTTRPTGQTPPEIELVENPGDVDEIIDAKSAVTWLWDANEDTWIRI